MDSNSDIYLSNDSAGKNLVDASSISAGAEKVRTLLTNAGINPAEAQQLLTYYRCAIMEVETKFNVLNRQFSLQQDYNPIDTIKTRLKSPESIIEKANRRGMALNLKTIEREMFDIAGVRVICPFVQDIYTVSDCLLSQDDIALLQTKDYIANPKPNGYRSLHLIVETPIFLQSGKRLMNVEIQLRTIAMEFWANLEHRMRYKKEIPPQKADALSQALQDCAETSAALDLRMEEIKRRMEE